MAFFRSIVWKERRCYDAVSGYDYPIQRRAPSVEFFCLCCSSLGHGISFAPFCAGPTPAFERCDVHVAAVSAAEKKLNGSKVSWNVGTSCCKRKSDVLTLGARKAKRKLFLSFVVAGVIFGDSEHTLQFLALLQGNERSRAGLGLGIWNMMCSNLCLLQTLGGYIFPHEKYWCPSHSIVVV